MAVSKDYLEFLAEQLAPLGFIETKRMFGGAGIYCDGLMFGLVADDELYLKVDDNNRAVFEAEGLGPFIFETKAGSKTAMSYHTAPGAALDDPEIMQEWGRLGVAAALRAAAKKRPKKSTRKVKP